MTNKIEQGDYRALLRKICAAAGKNDLPRITSEEIESLLRSTDWNTALSAVRVLCGRDHMPTNLLGGLENVIREIEQNSDKAKLERETWRAQEGCCTPEEWQYLFRITAMIMRMHISGETPTNPDGITIAMTIDEYKQAGMPATWSPILDHFLKGYYQAYMLDKTKNGALVDYLKKYCEILQNRNKTA